MKKIANSNNYEVICNVCTLYSLFLYLLYSKDSDIARTFYIFNPAGIPETVRCKLMNSYTMPDYNRFGIIRKIFISLFGFIYFRIIKKNIPALKTSSKIIGNDFSRYDPVIIGKTNYTVIEDAPNGFSQSYLGFFKKFDDKEKRKGLLYKLMRLLYGEIYYQRFGNNQLCQGVILTHDEHLDYLKGKKKYLVNIKDEWNKSSLFKRDLITSIFSISKDDIYKLRTKRIVIFTQPLYPDFISKEEHACIYKKIIERYSVTDIVVKTHPRDHYQYENDFKDLYVLRSPVPSQLLDLLEIKFDKAITLFSTAVKSLSYDIPIDWYGFAGNKTLESLIGNVSIPHNANKIDLQ